MKTVSKRDFIQNTSKFLKVAEKFGIVLTYHRKPCLVIKPIKPKSIYDLKDFTTVTFKGDINEPVLEDLSTWLS
ncbi:MAG: hypothetical protein A3F17_02800 [Gammaproteobacteria bacterium RIFCSPHIGHO2_12_FULL_41_15]|nr:MAG: hypothetical protein A3F17_02800 [Gammaproteobacteria bacterium RIFCSPHIGHO2_12_FULL_41_15]